MTTADAHVTTPASIQPVLADEPLPVVVTALSGDEVRQRLDAASRKGRLPGLRLECAKGLFEVREFGQPFESTLVATLEPGSSAHKNLRFSTHIRWRLPAFFAFMMIISVWPGIYLVDSMLKHYFTWYNIPTWWWYLPLTVPSTPWVIWSAWQKSRSSADVTARETIGKIRSELGH